MSLSDISHNERGYSPYIGYRIEPKCANDQFVSNS